MSKKLAYGKFKTGPFHVFNPIPKNEKEVLQHGNALADSGNYPVGTSACFNIGISGGCGIKCFVYQNGECEESNEMIPRLKIKELKAHYKLYD